MKHGEHEKGMTSTSFSSSTIISDDPYDCVLPHAPFRLDSSSTIKTIGDPASASARRRRRLVSTDIEGICAKTGDHEKHPRYAFRRPAAVPDSLLANLSFGAAEHDLSSMPHLA
jgi:hypothetical protein